MQAMAAAPVVGGAASAQQTGQAQKNQAQKNQAKSQKKDGVVYSPENIGGGGRVERNFYREWVKTSKVPMVEGYSITDAATRYLLSCEALESTQEALAFTVFERTFQDFGLPLFQVLSD